MQSDGGPSAPGWDDDGDLDSFGWSYQYSGTDGTASAGFLLSGDPASTDPTWVTGAVPLDGTNTYYGATSLCGATILDGTGYLTRDFWWLEDPTGASTQLLLLRWLPERERLRRRLGHPVRFVPHGNAG